MLPIYGINIALNTLKSQGKHMIDIEQNAIKTFHTNLGYFANEHPEIYKKVDILNQAIENGQYIEKYSLEYRNNYFDVLEISSNQYLYNENSFEHAKKLSKTINYKKSDNVIEGFYHRTLSERSVNQCDGLVDINNNLFATARIMQYHDTVTSENDDMKDIFKFIFCGVGLGIHIEEIEKKTQSKLVLIVEDNLELFRLSLFVTDYQKVSSQSTLFFSIMDDDVQFKKTFEVFFTRGYTHNHYIKYALLSQNDIKTVKRIQNFIVLSGFLAFPYAMILKELLKAPEYLVEQYPFLNISEQSSLGSPLRTKPVLLVAAGPSLQRNITWLQENKDKFFIVALLASVPTLHKYNIKPDVVTHMDASVSEIFLDDIDIQSYFSKTLFILSAVVSRQTLNILPKEQIYCFESSTNYKKDFPTISAPSIGEVTYAITLLLGATQLYLLGLDLALDSETKSTHSAEHFSNQIIEESQEHDNYTSVFETIFYTRGNFLDEVPITPVYRTSVLAFNQKSKELLTQEQKVYNLNNGAFLEGTIPLHVEDINTEQFSKLNDVEKFHTLKIFFDSISEDKMSKVDIENLEYQITEAQRLLALVEEFKHSATTSNFVQYMKQFEALYNELLNFNGTKMYDINRVFSSYLQYIASYIFDIFNTKQLKNQKRHVKKINEIYIRQLLKILNLYLITMNVYQEWAKK